MHTRKRTKRHTTQIDHLERLHFNYKLGSPEQCGNPQACEFARLESHNTSSDELFYVAAKAFKMFHEWTRRSAVPQLEGWRTFHIFEPGLENGGADLSRHAVLKNTPVGYVVVGEDGTAYKKVAGAPKFQDMADPPNWLVLENRIDPRLSLNLGREYDSRDLVRKLPRSSRIEGTENLPAFQIDWGVWSSWGDAK